MSWWLDSESMDYLRSDQYTHVSRDCPIYIDLYPADNLVEIALGDYRAGGATLRLVVDHPDTCLRLVEALHAARHTLIEHLRARADSGLSHVDQTSRWPQNSGKTEFELVAAR
ncbi:hypothetical protein [Actinophytocola sp.]|uniref:hypothetical protein n=1 Tax=Actinophytocola sp. TaxID=1872138 RepID=UPI002ED3158B